MTLSGELAGRASALRFRDLPQAAVTAAKVSLADVLAVSLAAVALEPAAAVLADHAAAAGGPKEATVIGRADRLPVAQAALANGALAHALDFEDTHDAAKVHPNAAVVPAVLALAEREGADGETVLTALALGADLVCRLGLALGDRARGRGWYQPPMLGAMGAALAAARVLGLGADGTVAAMALTPCLFALPDGFMESPHSRLRAVRDGFAARAGVEAADLARRGLTGAPRPLEGPGGLLDMLGGAGTAAGLDLGDHGRRFLGAEVAIKRWPSCRGTHGAIAAALAIRDQGIAPAGISAIACRVSPPDDMLFHPVERKRRPATAIDAKFSIPFTMATALAHGRVDLASFAPDRLADPVVTELAARIHLEAVLDAGDPRTGFTLRLADGRVLDLPMPAPPGPVAGEARLDALHEKVAGCLACVSGGPAAEDLLAAVAGLERTGPGPLLALLSG